jgi:hypothetical protein
VGNGQATAPPFAHLDRDHGEDRLLCEGEPGCQCGRQSACGGPGAASFHRGRGTGPGSDTPLYGLLWGWNGRLGVDERIQFLGLGLTDLPSRKSLVQGWPYLGQLHTWRSHHGTPDLSRK